MKKVCLALFMGLMAQVTFAQTLGKMQWFNEPDQWEIKDNVLSMSVTPQSDYWRISHYGLRWMMHHSIMLPMVVSLKRK